LCNTAVDLNAPRKSGIPGWEKGLHIDHFIPVSKGGPDTLNNVRPTHGLCNIRKHAKVKNG
jgi:5-methylcytosine-specific restriction endonuclease McrA